MDTLADSLSDTLAVFDDADAPDTPRTTSEVADALDCSRRTAYNRLERLVERGDLETKKVGAKGRIWWRTDDALHDSQFQSLVAAVGEYAIFVLDPEGRVASWNEGAANIKGYDREEIVGEHLSAFYTEEDVSAGVPAKNLADAAAEGSAVDEGWRIRADGSKFWASVTISAIRTDNGDLRGYTKVTRDMTDAKHAEAEHTLLHSATRSIAAADSFEDGLRATLETVCEATDWKMGEAWLPTDDGVLERAPADYAETTALERFCELSEKYTFEYGVGLPGRVWQSGDPEWMTDVSERSADEFHRAEDADEFDAESWLGVPITTDEEVVAILAFSMHEAREIDRRLVKLVSSVADELGELVERRRAETALAREKELTDRILEASPTGIIVFDGDGGMVRANERMADIFGNPTDEMAGYTAGQRDLFDGDGDPIPFEERPVGRVLETGETATDHEAAIQTPDGETRWVSVTAVPIVDEDDEIERVVATVNDVTQLKRQSRRLERQRNDLEHELEEVFERIDDAFVALDGDFRFTYVNDRASSLLETASAELVGRNVWDLFESGLKAEESFETALRTQESVTFEEFYEPLDTWFEVHAYPSETGLSVYFRDVTDRKWFEDTLKALHDSSRDLLAAESESEVSRIVVDAASEVLDIPGVVVYRHDSEDGRLFPDEQSVEAGFMRRAFPEVSVGKGSITGATFAEGDSRHYDDICEDPELQIHPDDTEMRSGSFVSMDDHAILVAGAREVGAFDHQTHQLVELLAANAEAAYDRVSREKQLERQRERLAALNELNGVVRDINEALVQQSTREAVAEVVCERLAASDSYRFAWFGEIDPRSGSVTLGAEAGVEGYFEDISLSVDADDPTGRGPTGRAIQTMEVQVTRNTFDDPDFEPWRDHAEAYGFRSSAAIPIVHEGTLYGVFGVYADRPEAFEGEERRVVGQLGEVVGHTLASLDRKRALMSDELVKLEFQIPDVFETFGAPATEGTVSFDRTVPVGDGEFLEYGTATGDAMETVWAMVDTIPHWESVTVVSETFDATTFELRLSEPPVISLVASKGGYIETATLTDGDYHMTLHFPPTVDIRPVVERIREAYPSVEVVTRRQISGREGSAERFGRVLTDEMTDRQRTTLEAAYFAGFFEWPRDSSAQEVAESLGIADSTFHQHVRLAENKLLGTLFEEPATSVR